MHNQPHYSELERFDKQFDQFESIDAIVEYFKQPSELAVNSDGSEIRKFYKGKHIFLTGGTGFVGLLVVEKLLRVSPDLGKIYLLIRSKKGKDAKTRISDYFENEVFSEMKRFCPNYLEKVVPIAGDVAELKLGISDGDRKILIDNVNIIIHGAATVRFDQDLKTAVHINVRGTKELLELGKQSKHLISFVYVSTAYSNCVHDRIKEEIYDYPTKPEEIMQLVERTNSEELEKRTSEILGKFPNTYSFTKCLAENVVKGYMNDLPISLFRPAMILTTYREPLKGWVNNIYGPLAFILATGMGLQHVILTDTRKRIDMVPADFVVNGLLAVCFKTIKDKGKVYNFVSRPCVQRNIKEFNNTLISAYKSCPVSKGLWRVYTILMTRHYSVFLFFGFFFHYIPAYIFTCLAKISGTKLKIDLIGAVRKLHEVSKQTSLFTTSEWTFEYENMDNLWKEISEGDKCVFPFDMRELNWNLYPGILAQGLRRYFVKEDMSTIPQGRKQQQLFKILNYLVFALVWIAAFLILNTIYNLICL